MIEVEKKIALRPGDRERLLTGATFLKEKRLRDIYFDDKDFSLTVKDWWLRKRNDAFELKVPIVAPVSDDLFDQYHEFEDEQSIRQELALPTGGTFADDIAHVGIVPIIDITTTRQEYSYDGFIIDIDSMDFGYEVAEIELLVASQAEVDVAMQKITAFIVERGLMITQVYGKVLTYLERYSPAHFQKLMDAWGWKRHL